MIVAPGSTVIFAGDSITDCGRQGSSLGAGYVMLVDAYLKARRGASRIRVQNAGVSGNTIRDLAARWDDDVLENEPEWVVILIGINDVWRQFDRYLEVETHVRLPEYRSTMSHLVASAKSAGSEVIVMSPFFVEPNIDDPMRSLVEEYAASAMEVAGKCDALYVDLQGEFDEMVSHVPVLSVTNDRVHVGPAGHMRIALSFLESIRALA